LDCCLGQGFDLAKICPCSGHKKEALFLGHRDSLL
jgi:hypothetical protein